MRTHKWKASLAILVLAVSLATTACGGKKQTPAGGGGGGGGGTSGATSDTAKKSAAMVSDVGGLNDKSFNQAAWSGLQQLEKENGFKVKAVESKRQEEYEPNVATMVDAGYNLIWGIGFLMGDAITASATKYPKQNFALIDAEAKGKNVASILFKEQEGSFLMGVIAAKTSKTKKVGFVGGMDIPVVNRFEAGFKAGVQTVDPSVQVLTVYAGTFTDPGKGKDVALNMINQGADIVYHAAGGTGEGVIEAAKNKGAFAIGVDRDQSDLAPETVISSMVKKVDLATHDVSLKASQGNFTGGSTTYMGLKEGGVGYSPTTKWAKMPAGTKDLVDKWATAIRDGKLQVPASLDTLKSFKPPTL